MAGFHVSPEHNLNYFAVERVQILCQWMVLKSPVNLWALAFVVENQAARQMSFESRNVTLEEGLRTCEASIELHSRGEPSVLWLVADQGTACPVLFGLMLDK